MKGFAAVWRAAPIEERVALLRLASWTPAALMFFRLIWIALPA